MTAQLSLKGFMTVEDAELKYCVSKEKNVTQRIKAMGTQVRKKNNNKMWTNDGKFSFLKEKLKKKNKFSVRMWAFSLGRTMDILEG